MREKVDTRYLKTIKIIWTTVAVLAVALITLMIIPKKEYDFSVGKTYGMSDEGANVIENVTLPRGVYRVLMSYSTNSNEAGFVQVYDGSTFSGGLVSNGEVLFADRDSTDFTLWLFDSADDLYLTFDGIKADNVEISNVTFQQTGQLWGMLLFYIATVALLLTLILGFIGYDKKTKITREKKMVVFGIALMTILSSIPCLFSKAFDGADFGYHVARIEGVKNALLNGNFIVRLEPSMLFNRGYANGIFYSDLYLYIPALLRIIGFDIPTSYHIFFVIVNFATAMISYACFTKIFKDRYVGLACAALYTTSSVRSYMFMGGVVGQLCAATFLPILLLAYYRLFSEDRKENEYKSIWPLFVLGYSGIIQSHVLTCEITLFWTVVVCVVFVRQVFRKETFCQLLFGAMGTFLANAWFLIPFVDYYFTQDITIRHYGARTIQEVGCTLKQVIPFFGYATDDYFRDYRGMGFFLAIGMLLFIIMWVFRLWKNAERHEFILAKVCAVFGLISCVFALQIFPWNSIQKLPGMSSFVANIQFPYRFLVWGTVFAICVLGFVISFAKKEKMRFVLPIILTFCLASIGVNHEHFMEERVRNEVYSGIVDETMQIGYISGGEYVLYGTDTYKQYYGRVISSDCLELADAKSEYLKGNAVVTKNSGSGYVEFPLMYYKGYRAWDENRNRLECGLGTNNVVRIEIPDGYTGTVSVKFVSPWYWRVCEVISALFIAWMVVAKVRKHSSIRCSDNSSAFQAPSPQGEGKASQWEGMWVLYGAVVYLTTPYMLYLLFESKSISGLGAYLLCPLILLVYNFADKLKYKWISHVSVGVGLILLAKFRPIVALMMIFTFVIIAFVRREWIYTVISFAGFGIGSMLNLDFWKFVLLGTETAKSVPLRTIGSESYQLGQLLMSWTFFERHPGIGFGIGLSLLALVWLAFFERERDESKNVRAMTWLAVVFIVASLIGPIWDLAARVSPVILRLLSEMGSPVELLGFALSLLLIPVVRATKRFYEKGYSYISVALPLFSLGLALLAFVKWIILLK